MLSPDYDTDEWIRLNIAMSRCHREKGDAARSVAVAEGAFARVAARPGPWSDETVKLGATLVGAYLERGDLVSGGQLADRLIEQADAIGSSVARMAAYWEAADRRALPGRLRHGGGVRRACPGPAGGGRGPAQPQPAAGSTAR